MPPKIKRKDSHKRRLSSENNKNNVISIDTNLKTVHLQQDSYRRSRSPQDKLLQTEDLQRYQTYKEPDRNLFAQENIVKTYPSAMNLSVGDQIFEIERKISDLNHLYKLAQNKRDVDRMA